MDEPVEKNAILYLPPDGDQGMLDAVQADGWNRTWKDDQLESAFLLFVGGPQDLLKPPDPPHQFGFDHALITRPTTWAAGSLERSLANMRAASMEWGHFDRTASRRTAQPPTTRPPINDDVAGRIDGDVVDLPPGPRPEEIDSLLGRHEPNKERANVPPPKPRRPKPVALALTRDARRRAEAEGIAMARGTECLDAANAFDALWAIKPRQNPKSANRFDHAG